MKVLDGLQTRSFFAVHCEVYPDRIVASRLWLADWELLGKTISVVDSLGRDRYTVKLPTTPLTFPAENVELERIPDAAI